MALGSGGQLVPPVKLLDGPACVYGILRGCGEIIRSCEWVGREYWHIDHGYLHGNKGYNGYYRITKNGRQWAGNGDYAADRFNGLQVRVRPWYRGGTNVVVCPISKMVADYEGIDHHQWLMAIVDEIQRNTERPVVIKPKGEGSLFDLFRDAWCLVTHASNAAVDAVIAGIPVFTLGPSAARPMGLSDLSKIDTPVYPDREQWLNGLAYNQWNLDEFRRGELWEHM